MFYTPIPSIKPCSTHVNPKICVFSPFLALFRQKKHSYPPPAEKTATEAHRRPNSPAAPSRPSAVRPVACPVARPLGLAPLWARGRGVCGAPFGSPRPAVVPPACAPCSSLPSASDALLLRLNGAPCADGRGVGGQQSRPSAARPAPSPPASPPFRRPLAWSRRLWCAWWGQLLPRPLAASPSSVWSAWPLAALSHASARRAGAWPLRPSGAPAACLRALAWPMAAAPAVAWGKAGLFISRGLAPLPPPRPSKGAPPFPPSCSPAARTRAEILAGDGGRALVPRACGAVGCARGARPCIPAVSAVCLPASGRARSACRAVCAVRALRRASPPSSGGQVRALKGFPILQREHRGTGTRLRRSDHRQ